jgi:starch binding protein with CBM20 domain
MAELLDKFRLFNSISGIPIASWQVMKSSLLTAVLLLASAIAVRAVDVTFQVNMEVQTTMGNLNPSVHTVEVRGSFDNWGTGVTLSASETNANIYKGTVNIIAATGTQIQYKFVINQAGALVWENNGVGPGGAQNRAFNVPASAQTLSDVYFNNQSTPPGVVAVTFQVNMAVQTELGNFDPLAHRVEVHGSFDNWGPGITLSQSAGDPNIYQGTTNVTGSAGTLIEHKFVMNRAGSLVWEDNVGQGAFGNRTFTLASTPQTLPVVYFNNVTNNPGAGIRVTFQANMALQIARGAFNSESGIVDARGPFNNWGTPSALVLTNSPSNPWVYAGSLNVSNASPGSAIPYKFNMNGTWETGGDRTFILASSAQALPPRYFDDVADLGRLSISSIFVFETEITVSWTGGPRIRLQSRSELSNGQWEDVPETAGQSTKSFLLPLETPGNMFFRLVGP